MEVVVPSKLPMLPFRVLCLDGGGIRGLYTASLLHSIAAHFGAPGAPDAAIGQNFDLIAGTSTGGILACGLAAGETTGRMIDLYEEIGPRLFRDPMPSKRWPLLRWAFRHRNTAANDPKPLRQSLESIFGAKTLRDVYQEYQIALCLPAGRAVDWSAKVFKTPHHPAFTRDGGVTLVDACMATSAAPLFFPVAEVQEAIHLTEKGRFIDGGLWANNPTLVALIEALTICADAETGILTRPIEILSLGTSGGPSGDEPGMPADRGMLQWKFGGGVANMSVALQGRAYDDMTRLLVRHLVTLGQSIRYGRVPNPAITGSQAAELALDRATPRALSLLKSLGDTQAQYVQSECSQQTPLGNLVTSIFQTTPPSTQNL